MVRFLYSLLHLTGGFSLYAPDKTVNYSTTPASCKYAFTFWAFPREQWLKVLREYLDFADAHFKKCGFRCNMPLGSYFIHRDSHSILSCTHDGEIFSIDPIHACTDQPAWDRFSAGVQRLRLSARRHSFVESESVRGEAARRGCLWSQVAAIVPVA